MKRSFLRRSPVILVGLLLGLLVLTGTSWAQGDWFLVHGTSGVIQSPAEVTAEVYGWGLTFTLSGLSTWVHYAPPSKPFTKLATYKQWRVRYIRLKFETGSSDIRVTAVHVYDGNIQFMTFDKTWATSWYGSNDIVLDLGQSWDIYRALGISICVERGVESMDHSVQFYAVGARWD